jgi:hypothetical protein
VKSKRLFWKHLLLTKKFLFSRNIYGCPLSIFIFDSDQAPIYTVDATILTTHPLPLSLFPFKCLMTTLAFCLLLVGSSSLYLTGVISEAPGKKELAECAAQALSHLKQGNLQIELHIFDMLTTVIILISSTM